MKKALGETQTLRAGRSNAKPKIFSPSPAAEPFPGAQDGMVWYGILEFNVSLDTV